MSEIAHAVLAHGWVASPMPALRTTKGDAIDDATRRELLERSYRGEQVEVLMPAVTFVQSPNDRNRNFVRFRDERLEAIAATGANTPFLRDHAQGAHADKGGMWIESKAVRNGDAVEFHALALLTVPWAVQAALQRTLTHFSIGWNPLPPPGKHEPALTCSLCQEPVRLCVWEKGHWRGTAHGALVVEWIVENAELIEASAVNVPAEPRARPLGIKPAHDLEQLEAELRFFGVATIPPPRPPTPTGPRAQEQIMDKSKLCGLLGLSPDAGEAEILAAIQANNPANNPTAAKSLEHKVEALSGTVEELSKTVSGALQTLLDDAKESRTKARNAEVQGLLDAAIQDGRLQADGPIYQLMRDKLLADLDSGRPLLEAMPRQTPVAVPRQSDRAEQPGANTTADAKLQAALEADADELKIVKRAGLAIEDYIRVNRHSLLTKYGME